MGQSSVEYSANEVDIRNYAKYVLIDGTIPDKRDLLNCMKSKLRLSNKILSIIV